MFNIQNLRVEEGIPQVVYDMREDGHGEGDSWGKRWALWVLQYFKLLLKT